MLQLYINFSADEHLMRYTYRDFIFNFAADEHLMIFTYRNFISIFLQLYTWWYIHTATLYQLSRRWTRDDIYVPQLYMTFSADEHLIIYTYRNFISIFLQMNTWWYLQRQLYINFAADEHVVIYRYRNFISTFLLTNTW